MTAVPPEGAWLAGAGTPAEEQGAAIPPESPERRLRSGLAASGSQ